VLIKYLFTITMETLELTLRNNAPAVPICMMLFF
jgi:hypothetical protein